MIISGPEYYPDDHVFSARLPNFSKTRIQIIDGDTFTIAKRFDNPCCLNFASHKRPGGGYKAVQDIPMPIKTQEEDLFRRSNLPSLMDDETVRNYYPLKGRAAFYCGGTFGKVVVTKDAYLNPVPHHNVSLITLPAVVNPQPHHMELVEGKARRVLEIAAHHRHFDLILGAWGCGVFANDPEHISKLFKRLIREEFEGIFDLVLFAIPNKESKTYKVFESNLLGG